MTEERHTNDDGNERHFAVDVGSKTKTGATGNEAGVSDTVTGRAFDNRRAPRYADRNEPLLQREAPRVLDGLTKGQSPAGSQESLLASAEHLAQLSASLAVFATACLHQGIFLYCASTQRDRSLFHGQGYLDRSLFTDTISATWVI